ncbi:phosphotriesterase family protein [Dactylosporangium sp. CA-233914]|uniref:phosphotriesterase family protein n=1 Tax=Dactylosporangium sp. CA-233914 TaxID=3239934 RepID=UPI003D8F6173
MADALSVLGPVSAENLGFVLPHEHLTTDSSALIVPGGVYPVDTPMSAQTIAQVKKWPRSLSDNLIMDADDVVLTDLIRYKDLGGGTLVDLTPIGMGRDLERYRQLSRASGVNVIACTGYYVKYGHKGRVEGRTPDDLAAEFIAELREGDGVSRCGAMGEIGISAVPEPDEWNVLKAAIIAQQETGAPIWIHITTLRPVPELLAFLTRNARDLSRIVICHMDYSLEDLDVHRRALETGVNVEFDMFGAPWWSNANFLDLPTDSKRVRALLTLSAEGAADQLFVSQDTCMKQQLSAWGGFSYGHMLESVAELFTVLDAPAGLLHRFAVENTRRLLCWA